MIGGLTVESWVVLALPALAVLMSLAGWLGAKR